MAPYFKKESGSERLAANHDELKTLVNEVCGNCEKIAEKIKVLSLTGNFDENEEIKSINFQAMAGLVDDLFRQMFMAINELKKQLREKQNEMTTMIRTATNTGSEEYERNMREFEEDLRNIMMMANKLSETVGSQLGDIFETLKDTSMSSYIIQSIYSEFDVKLSVDDSPRITKPALKSQIYSSIKPAHTQRLIPAKGEEGSGVTTYYALLEEAMKYARARKSSPGGEDPEPSFRLDYDDEDTVVSEPDPGSDSGDQDDEENLPTLVVSQEELFGRSLVETLKPSKAVPEPVVAKPEPAAVKPEPTVPKPEPVVVKPAPVVVKTVTVTTKPAPVAAKLEPTVVKAAVTLKTSPQTTAEPVKVQESEPPVRKPAIEEPTPSPETLGPEPVIKKTRRSLWAVIGAGAALAAAAIFGTSAIDNGNNSNDNTATITTTASDNSPEIKESPAPVKVEQQDIEKTSAKRNFTVNTDHADYAKYLKNFTGMHAFIADLNYAASHSEFELSGKESANQAKLKTLRGFLESGTKTATSVFSQKAFAAYLETLDHLEAEINAGRIDIDSPDFMGDGRYKQIRIMADGIHNVVPSTPPENIAGYKIDKNDCHPLAVFSHNYLHEGGAPAFHATVINTLDNIVEKPFERNDGGYVTNEFFSRLHRQAAVQKAKNSIDGSPAVANSIERFVRAGGRNEISEMLRGCVVPVYKSDVNAKPDTDEVKTPEPSNDKAIPIKYIPDKPATTGFNVDPKRYEVDGADEILANITSMLADNGPQITVTGEEEIALDELSETSVKSEWKDSWGNRKDTDDILSNVTAMLADDQPVELTDDDIIEDDAIELTEADFIEDDAIELTEADFIEDDAIELTEADFIEDDAVELTEADLIVEEPKLTPPPAPPLKEKKGFFARAASKMKRFFS